MVLMVTSRVSVVKHYRYVGYASDLISAMIYKNETVNSIKPMSKKSRYQQAKKITLIGTVTTAFIAFIKIVAGFLFHSHGLVADGFHSIADLLTDFMVLIGAKYGNQDADDTHPYGHQRIETATTLMLSLFLILAGAGIAWDAILEVIHQQHNIPKMLALPIAILSIIANEILFQYTLVVGNKINSSLIIANAWHRRSDAASSLVVCIGIMGSFWGYKGFDAIAAIIVSIMIIKMGWDYGWNSIKELVDTAIDPITTQKIQSIIAKTNGVQKIHQLRSRSMGSDTFIDVHIQVSPWISVSEGHYIAQHVHNKLMSKIKTIKDVTVHVDPEDDETSDPSLHLPSRSVLEKKLLRNWKKECSAIESWLLHYLDGKLTIDLICNRPLDAEEYQYIQNTIHHIKDIHKVRVFVASKN